jgi:hypothetical protein
MSLPSRRLLIMSQIDEAHERGAYTDLLLGLIKKWVHSLTVILTWDLMPMDNEETTRIESHHFISDNRRVSIPFRKATSQLTARQ